MDIEDIIKEININELKENNDFKPKTLNFIPNPEEQYFAILSEVFKKILPK